MSDALLGAALKAFDARLERGVGHPLAVAFSGGGDSLALLLAAKAWADQAGRRLVALTVDHQLQDRSAEWAAWCADRAARLGIEHRTLVWDGAKPSTGVPSAARAARHRLIADAAREAGAKVVLFGHTADDVLEAVAMREGGVRISAPGEWTPSPVWPEGRGIFILRPLLGLRRAELRAFLLAQGETWIDDPANEDLRHPRARARAELAGGCAQTADEVLLHTALFAATFGPAGDVTLFSNGADDYPEIVVQLGAAAVCAAGAERPPRRDALERLAVRLGREEVLSVTLGGARIVRAGERIHVVRETGDSRGRRCEPVGLTAGETVIWDGRFEVRARGEGLTLAPLAGRAASLDAGTRKRLSSLHPAVRGALPALIDAGGAVSFPAIEADPRLMIRDLVPNRMAGACGVVDREERIDIFA